MQPFLILIYLSLCLLVGFMGRRTRLGYWGTAAISIVVTPVLVYIVLVLLPLRPRSGDS